MYTLGRHVIECKNQGALVIPAMFLHQELPIRLSHALKALHPNSLPFNRTGISAFRDMATSYLEDISMVTRMPKPSTPQLEEEFTVVLRSLEQRHAVRMLAISQGFQEFMSSTGAQYKSGSDGGCTTATNVGYDTGRWMTIDPQMDKDIQTFFDQLYTIHLGTRLLIGEHLALHDRGLNLVQRVNPLVTSKTAIKDAQRVCAAHYGQPAPSVLVQTPDPSISLTCVDEFLHRNLYELLKNAMRATCETHHRSKGAPVSLSMVASGHHQAAATAAVGSVLPPITLTLVEGGEDVTIKITDQSDGLALSELDKIWGYAHTSTTFLGGFGNEVTNQVLNGPSDGLPLTRLIARYFGGELSLISMEGHGTHSYLSLHKDDDYLENISEVEKGTNEETLREVDVFVNDLMNDSIQREVIETGVTLSSRCPMEPTAHNVFSTVMDPATSPLPSSMG
ncbi:hypothetical protein BGX34_005959 [Mortierella sp. NVP85]|nr:hypothetical protein BGX34_005959 [Mortierella sp. NVP85]